MTAIHLWQTDPATAFDAFLTSPAFARTSRRRPADGSPKPLSEESAAIYRFMFRKFAAWLAGKGLTLVTLSETDLFDFLDQRHPDGTPQLNSNIAQRYLRLLERCYRHLNIVPNPARSAMFGAARGAHALGRDQEMAVLDSDQAARFLAALPPFDGNWKRHRDRAMQLVMLFGGLTVAEAIGFMLSEVTTQANLDGSLTLALVPPGKHRSSYRHTTKLHAVAVPELLAWLAARGRLPFQGNRVFPGNLRGDPLNKSTVYRQVKATFERAALALPRLGGRTLRNTFAVRELEAVSIAELTEHLGLALARSTDRYVAAKKRLGETALATISPV